MENTKAVVNLDVNKQFFEITEGLVNFEVDFEVKTENNTPFEIAVVDQNTLDSDKFPYRKIENGQANGKVTNDSNRKLSFFMVLKSDTPTKATVSLQKHALPYTGQDEVGVTPQPQQQRRVQKQKTKKGLSERFSNIAKNKTALILLVVACAAALYYFRKRRSVGKFSPSPNAPSSVVSSPVSPTTSADNNFGF